MAYDFPIAPAIHFRPEISIFLNFFLFIYDSHTHREREAETQVEGEAGSMHQEPDVGFDPGSPGSRPGPKAGAKPLHHPGIPVMAFLNYFQIFIASLFREKKPIPPSIPRPSRLNHILCRPNSFFLSFFLQILST